MSASSSPHALHPRDDSPLTRRVQVHHSHTGPLPNDDAEEAAAGGTPGANERRAHPVGHTHLLYRHALESIFAFADLNDLHALLSVCAGWQSAVLSMRPILAPISHPCSYLSLICQSSLRIHVGILSLGWQVSPASDLALVAAKLSSLRQLSISVQPTGPLRFPDSITKLQLTIPMQTDIDVITHIGGLRQLRQLGLFVQRNLPASLAPLARLPKLRRLTVCVLGPASLVLSDAQVQQLRDMPLLEYVSISPHMVKADNMSRLLAPPHTLQWREMTYGSSDSVGALLPLLPSLTTVDVGNECTHLDWAASLPSLTHLRVWFGQALGADLPRAFAGLQRCSALTELKLRGVGSRAWSYSSEQLAATLPRLLLLRALTLHNDFHLMTLAFLSQQPTARTLTALHIEGRGRHVPVGELQHVNSLRALEQLTLTEALFSQPLPADVKQQYTPPSLLVPSLQHFTYRDRP